MMLRSMKACSRLVSLLAPALSRKRMALARSALSVVSCARQSYSLAPLCVISDARLRAALTSCTFMGGGGALSSSRAPTPAWPWTVACGEREGEGVRMCTALYCAIH